MQTKKNILYIIGFLLLGLLFSRLFLEKDISITNFYKKFDIIMQIIITIGVFMMAIGIKTKTIE